MHLHSIDKHDFHMLKCKTVNLAPSLWLFCALTLTILRHDIDCLTPLFRAFSTLKKAILRIWKIQVVMFQYVTQITIIPLYDSDSRCRDFYASHADLKTQFIADFVPKKQNIKMSVMSSKTMTKHPQPSTVRTGSLHKHCPHAGNVTHVTGNSL